MSDARLVEVHRDWLGMGEREGLVVSAPVLAAAMDRRQRWRET